MMPGSVKLDVADAVMLQVRLVITPPRLRPGKDAESRTTRLRHGYASRDGLRDQGLSPVGFAGYRLLRGSDGNGLTVVLQTIR